MLFKVKGKFASHDENWRKLCKCTLCNLARCEASFSWKKKLERNLKKRQTCVKTCAKGFSEVRRGIKHYCRKSSKYQQVSSILKHILPKKKQHLVSEMLFEEARNNGSGSGSTLALSQQHGKPVLIDMRPKSRNNEISVDGMLQLRTRLRLSFNATSEIASFFRITLTDRKIIEKDLIHLMRSKSHLFDDYFDVAEA